MMEVAQTPVDLLHAEVHIKEGLPLNDVRKTRLRFLLDFDIAAGLLQLKSRIAATVASEPSTESLEWPAPRHLMLKPTRTAGQKQYLYLTEENFAEYTARARRKFARKRDATDSVDLELFVYMRSKVDTSLRAQLFPKERLLSPEDIARQVEGLAGKDSVLTSMFGGERFTSTDVTGSWLGRNVLTGAKKSAIPPIPGPNEDFREVVLKVDGVRMLVEIEMGSLRAALGLGANLAVEAQEGVVEIGSVLGEMQRNYIRAEPAEIHKEQMEDEMDE